MTAGSPNHVSSDEFRGVIGSFATGVTVITAHGAAPVGTTASAISSLSVEPPMVVMCLNAGSATGSVIQATNRFAINILREGQDELARRFAGKGDAKFDGVLARAGAHGMPLLEEALAHLECEVVQQHAVATHVVYLAEVRSARVLQGTPLAYFQGRFGRLELSPPQAAPRTFAPARAPRA